MDNPAVSFVIVNWNTKALLRNCLESILGTVKGVPFEVWVVDNASTDDSVQMVRQRFPRVKLIQNAENLGFARANNIALRRISGDYAVLLNSDTVLKDDAIETLIAYMEEHPETGVCGGALLNEDGSKQNSVANFPTLATELLNKSLLRRLFPKRFPGKESGFTGPVQVESVVGACMAVRKEAMDDTGLMDEDYFFFLEETDWCLKFRKKGWQVVHYPGAEVYHLQGGSARKAPVGARIEYWRSRYKFFRKNRSRPSRMLLRAGLVSKLVLSFVLMALLNLLTIFSVGRLRRKLRVYAALIGWHLKGCPESARPSPAKGSCKIFSVT
ncbi:MAG: glycosyltransferase family 2 protein [Thermodesulfobacteriota bacterium]